MIKCSEKDHIYCRCSVWAPETSNLDSCIRLSWSTIWITMKPSHLWAHRWDKHVEVIQEKALLPGDNKTNSEGLKEQMQSIRTVEGSMKKNKAALNTGGGGVPGSEPMRSFQTPSGSWSLKLALNLLDFAGISICLCCCWWKWNTKAVGVEFLSHQTV